MQQNLPKYTMASHSTLREPEICHVVDVLSVVIDVVDTASQAIFRLGASQGTVYELPTCPVCLERMDSAIAGLTTVPYSHINYCMCLSIWEGSRSYLLQHLVWSIWPSSCSSSLPKHDTFIRFRTGWRLEMETVCMVLGRRRLCSRPNPKR